tara:strand:+ start:294 stop:1280 length:987 start_codon:yes stop_codon:yes gene_type:complete
MTKKLNEDKKLLRFSFYIKIFYSLFYIIFFSACAPTHLAVNAIKYVQKQQESKNTLNSKESIKENNKNIPIGPGGVYKVGSPYIIKGVRYIPKIDSNYDKTGIASWYGKDFHGKRTANGEIYNMNSLTAAHKTLPMPTYVQVTNLDNGRALVVRINDRGPFVNNRIIDMSRRGAQLLGFERQGIAKVRVKVIGSSDEGFIANKPKTTQEEKSAVAAVPIKSVKQTPLNDIKNQDRNPPIKPPPEISLKPLTELNDIYIQVASFTLYQNANKLGAVLSTIAPINIVSKIINKKEFFRLRLGPFEKIEDADEVLEEVIKLGHPNAHIIIN